MVRGGRRRRCVSSEPYVAESPDSTPPGIIMTMLRLANAFLSLLNCESLSRGGGQQAADSPPERAEQDEGLEGGGPDPEAKQPL